MRKDILKDNGVQVNHIGTIMSHSVPTLTIYSGYYIMDTIKLNKYPKAIDLLVNICLQVRRVTVLRTVYPSSSTFERLLWEMKDLVADMKI